MLPRHAIPLGTTDQLTAETVALTLESDIDFLSRLYHVNGETVIGLVDVLIDTDGYEKVLTSTGKLSTAALETVARELAHLELAQHAGRTGTEPVR